jgi:hypothetical protein
MIVKETRFAVTSVYHAKICDIAGKVIIVLSIQANASIDSFYIAFDKKRIC